MEKRVETRLIVIATAFLAGSSALGVLVLRAFFFPGVWTVNQWMSIGVAGFVPAEAAWLILFAYVRGVDRKAMEKIVRQQMELDEKRATDERNN